MPRLIADRNFSFDRGSSHRSPECVARMVLWFSTGVATLPQASTPQMGPRFFCTTPRSDSSRSPGISHIQSHYRGQSGVSDGEANRLISVKVFRTLTVSTTVSWFAATPCIARPHWIRRLIRWFCTSLKSPSTLSLLKVTRKTRGHTWMTVVCLAHGHNRRGKLGCSATHLPSRGSVFSMS